MKIKYCTLTGADNSVDPQELFELSQQYPYVEWAILYSPSRFGTKRYPSLSWIDSFLNKCGVLNTAIHLCGDAVIQFMSGDNDVLTLAAQFARIQLNFNANSNKIDIPLIVIRAGQLNSSVITQHNKSNENVWHQFNNGGRHNILFDASGGRGAAPTSWPSPIGDRLCGYAGGLSPINLTEELARIKSVAGDTIIWVDMETGVRDNDDQFDLSKATACLEIAKQNANIL